MTDREKQIAEMEKLILEAERYHRRALCLNTVGETRLVCVCDWLYNAGYRKADKVRGETAVKLDEDKIRKQAVKEFVKRVGDELENMVMEKSSKFNDGYNDCIFDVRGLLDNLITELCVADE